jgi:predicted DsbA family dithiol-disulfide isomerase
MTVPIRLYTDFICPFCFVAEKGPVARLLESHDASLDWRGFELHPETPPEGRPLAELFPGMDLARMDASLRQFAAEHGVEDLRVRERLSNTRRALALAEQARDAGRLDAFRRAALDAYWVLGRDLGAEETLVAVAREAGLDPELARRAASDPGLLARVDASRAAAKADRVTAVPTLLIGGGRVVGCEPYDVLAEAADRAGIPRR